MKDENKKKGLNTMNVQEFRYYLEAHDCSKIILDTGVLIAYYENEFPDLANVMDDYFFSQASPIHLLCHQLSLTEIFYMCCRNEGVDAASQRIIDLKSMLEIVGIDQLVPLAGELKCKYAIALSDCFALALGIVMKVPIVFLYEQELTPEICESLHTQYNAKITLIRCEQSNK